jgi:flavodoxin
MNTLVICFSYHHKNTESVASVFAKPLGAEVKTPPEVDPNGLFEYDLIGFGSGIYFGKHHKVLLDFAEKVPQVTNKKAFIFSTSGQTGEKPREISRGS